MSLPEEKRLTLRGDEIIIRAHRLLNALGELDQGKPVAARPEIPPVLNKNEENIRELTVTSSRGLIGAVHRAIRIAAEDKERQEREIERARNAATVGGRQRNTPSEFKHRLPPHIINDARIIMEALENSSQSKKD